MKNIIITIAIVLLGIWLLTIAIDRQEKYECQKLAGYAEKYEGFYYAEHELKMCNIK